MKMFSNLFKHKLSKKEKLDFLEYLAFQSKSEMPFEKILIRYISSNGLKKKYIIDNCNSAIIDIRNGKTPSNALFENGFIEKLEYGIIKNTNDNKDLHISLMSIVNINKSNLKNKNILGREIRNGVLIFCGIFLLIPIFQEQIVSLYTQFTNMQDLVGDGSTKSTVNIPFLIKYWWSSFVLIGFIAAVFQSFKYLLNYVYLNHAHLYYRVFKNRLYNDLISVLKTFEQLQNAMSISNAYIALSNSSPNKYWSELFNEINLNLKQGGKTSDIFVSQKGILPIEIINCFIDAEDTGETRAYIEKALNYCVDENESINANISLWSPAIIQASMYLIVGYMLVAFVLDMLQGGLMDVMSKM